MSNGYRWPHDDNRDLHQGNSCGHYKLKGKNCMCECNNFFCSACNIVHTEYEQKKYICFHCNDSICSKFECNKENCSTKCCLWCALKTGIVSLDPNAEFTYSCTVCESTTTDENYSDNE